MKLIKVSSPGWMKEFTDRNELVDELRRWICRSCKHPGDEPVYIYNGNGDLINVGIEPNDMVVDVEYEGIVYECRDIPTLLATPCGLEFEVEYD